MRACVGVLGTDEYEVEAPVPPEFVCPFTHQVMHEPVLLCTPAGRTYEKLALVDWIARHPHRDPFTGHEHPHLHFVPNHALRAAISRWKTGYGPITTKTDHLRMIVDSAFDEPTSPHKEARKKPGRRHHASRKHLHADAKMSSHRDRASSLD